MKILPVGTELFHADGQDEANSLFPHSKAPKIHISDYSMNSIIKIFRKLEMVFETYRMLFKHLKRGRRGGVRGKEEGAQHNVSAKKGTHKKYKNIFDVGKGNFGF